jgi:hypothetical protein
MKTLKDGEKIGFIYYDNNSQVLKYLQDHYSGKFEKFYGSSAQGMEGRYYIADFTGSNYSQA